MQMQMSKYCTAVSLEKFCYGTVRLALHYDEYQEKKFVEIDIGFGWMC
jgi:hypothetical protein